MERGLTTTNTKKVKRKVSKRTKEGQRWEFLEKLQEHEGSEALKSINVEHSISVY